MLMPSSADFFPRKSTDNKKACKITEHAKRTYTGKDLQNSDPNFCNKLENAAELSA